MVGTCRQIPVVKLRSHMAAGDSGLEGAPGCAEPLPTALVAGTLGSTAGEALAQASEAPGLPAAAGAALGGDPAADVAQPVAHGEVAPEEAVFGEDPIYQLLQLQVQRYRSALYQPNTFHALHPSNTFHAGRTRVCLRMKARYAQSSSSSALPATGGYCWRRVSSLLPSGRAARLALRWR